MKKEIKNFEDLVTYIVFTGKSPFNDEQHTKGWQILGVKHGYNGDVFACYEIDLGNSLYKASFFRKEDNQVIEFERIIGKFYKHDINRVKDAIYGNNSCFYSYKRICRAKSENRVDIEYYKRKLFTDDFAHESVALGPEEKRKLDRFGNFNIDLINEKIELSQKALDTRKNYIQTKLDIRNYGDIYKRNLSFLNLVQDGLSLEETLGVVKAFVNYLPYSMDPLNCSFMPGEAFFNEPNDLNQVNHKAYSYDDKRTIFIGMKNWGDTRASSRAIALCVLFQKMLLENKNNYTVDDLMKEIEKRGIPKPENSNLLTEIVEKMVECANKVSKSKDQDRKKALDEVFKYISKTASVYGCELDLKLYYNVQDHSSKIKQVSFEPVDEAELIKLNINRKLSKALDEIYYNDNEVSLNSKRLYMIQKATEITNDKEYAVDFINKNYNFGLREVDIHNQKEQSPKIKQVSFEPVDETKSVKYTINDKLSKALDEIYYKDNEVSLNSKRLYMIQKATEITNDKEYAVDFINKNYNFDLREVDVHNRRR